MRIVYVIHHPGSGGMEKYSYLLAKKAIEAGNKVDFVFDHDGPFVDSLRKIGCEIHYIKMRAPYDIIAVWNLVKLFREIKPDIVHTNFLRENFLVIDASKLVHIPAIFTTIHRLETKNWLQARVNKLYSKGLTKVIAVSPLAKEYALSEGIAEGKIVTILNGAETKIVDIKKIRNEIGLSEKDKVISYVGRLSEEKGHKTLIKAFSGIRDDNLKLVLAGDGPLRNALEKLVKKEGLADGVIFTGYREDGFEIIAVSDIYVQPSEIENLPLSVAEAMLLGKVIIASDCAAHKFLLKDGELGYLFKNKNSKDLSKVIDIALKDSHAKEKAALAQSFAKNHLTVERMWSDTEKIYKKYANTTVKV